MNFDKLIGDSSEQICSVFFRKLKFEFRKLTAGRELANNQGPVSLHCDLVEHSFFTRRLIYNLSQPAK